MSTTDEKELAAMRYAETLDGRIRDAAKRPEPAWNLAHLLEFGNLVDLAEELGIHDLLGYQNWETYRDDATRECPNPTVTATIADIPAEYRSLEIPTPAEEHAATARTALVKLGHLDSWAVGMLHVLQLQLEQLDRYYDQCDDPVDLRTAHTLEAGASAVEILVGNRLREVLNGIVKSTPSINDIPLRKGTGA